MTTVAEYRTVLTQVRETGLTDPKNIKRIARGMLTGEEKPETEKSKKDNFVLTNAQRRGAEAHALFHKKRLGDDS